jgi:hypothetical protein
MSNSSDYEDTNDKEKGNLEFSQSESSWLQRFILEFFNKN